MTLTPADLRSVVARSSTISERMSGPFTASADPPEARAAQRLERLTLRAAGGDSARFDRYLRWHGWTCAALRRALGTVTCDGELLPDWAAVLEELGRGAGSRAVPPRPGAPGPFEEAFVPFLEVARSRLRARAPAPGRATERAWEAFECALIRQLSRIAARTLFAEFGAFRLATAIGDANGLGSSRATLASVLFGRRRIQYEAFVAHLRDGGLDRVLLAYPVLARLLAARVLDWVETTSEFLHRLAADTHLIEAAFGRGRLGAIAAVETDLSDRHHRGRTVSRITFASGLQLMYKPRSLALEAAFSSLLRWLNGRGVGLRLKALRVLDRGTHGWVESVVNRPCDDPAMVERYYRRAGMLLCVAYVFGGSDLHQGNVVASGEHPVLVDLEAFMSAPVRPDVSGVLEHALDSQQVWDSVLRTGLLPVTRVGRRGHPHRNGGLVALDPGYGRSVTGWLHVNTDAMAPDVRPLLPHYQNLPRLDGTPVTVERHADAVASGFGEMSRILQHARTRLLEPGGVLQAFRAARTRIVLRDTASYALLLEQALHPRLLQDGTEWSIEFEILKSSATACESKPRTWGTWLAEQRALERLDVPLFHSTSDGMEIAADDEQLVGDYLSDSGLANTRSRLAELDAERTRVHLQCIRLALRTRRCSDDASDAEQVSGATAENAGPWLPAAMGIAETLRLAADEPGGELQWVGIRGLDGCAGRAMQRVGWDLYGGRCGIALLFAALESRGIAPTERSFARRLLAPLVNRLLAGEPPKAVGRVSTIGATGDGGLVYALTAASRLTDSDAVLAAATRAAQAITREAIASDDRLDVMTGAAGAALGLLALFRTMHQPWVVDLAVLCGRHLVQQGYVDGGRSRALRWRVDGRAAAGFAHGSAGIAFALARLYRETGLAEFRDAAVHAIETDGPAGGSDLLGGARAREMRRSWCQGAAGRGLSCLEVSDLVGCPDLRADIDGLLDDVEPEAANLSRSDQVCCGNMGRIEVLTRAADALGRSSWRERAECGARRVIERAACRGSYAVSAIDDVFSPGYYAGLSGIGYALLRLKYPDLPSVLLWE